MSSSEGTIEIVAIELADILRPLQEAFTPGQAQQFFKQIGIPLTASQEASLVAPLTFTTLKTTELLNIIPQLLDSIDTDNPALIALKGKESIVKVKEIIDSFTTLANSIDGLGIPEVTPAVNTLLPRRIFHLLLFEYIDRTEYFSEVLEFLGILERTDQNKGSVDPDILEYTLHTFHFDKILGWLNNPFSQLSLLYDWGNSTFDGKNLLKKLEEILLRMGLPALYEETETGPRLDIVVFEIFSETDISPRGIIIKFNSNLSFGVYTFTQNDGKVEIKVDFQPPLGTTLHIRPNGTVIFQPPSSENSMNGDFSARFIAKRQAPPEPFIIFGAGGAGRLEVGEFVVDIGLKTSWDGNKATGTFFLEGEIRDVKLIIDTQSADGFLSSLLSSNNIESDFELLFGVSDSGLYFHGSGALEIHLPIHIEIGPVTLQAVTVNARLNDNALSLSFGVDIKTKLGPLTLIVQNTGVNATASFPSNGNGNLGPLDLDIAFKPPNLVGISIDTPAVKGGGFLGIDVEKGEYTGGIELTIQNTISIKAIGIITTKLPNGEEGYSLLLLITAEFNPLQLGFGFTLNGVGGLIGIHRGMNLSAIRVGVQTKALDHILFPDDPVANAPQIIANLNSIFPIAEDNYAFGLMFLIGWGVPTLLEVELGLMISFPSIDIAVIGKLSTALPDKKKPVLVLDVAFAGTLSFENKYFYFDARIENTSRLLSFTLSGDMAVRMLWGDQPNFVLSVGGFHPDFEIPKGLGLENMERITLSLLADDNPRLILKCYFAITSNTAQFGATIDFYFKKSKFKVIGFFYFHALFQFSPFYFIVSIGATLDVKLGSRSILSVGVEGNLEGPTPWKVKGKGRFKIWWVKYSVSFSKTWGEQIDTSLPDIAVYPELKKALLDDRNWAALLPENSTLTTLRDIKDDIDAETEEQDALIIHPFGSLSLAQRVVPLNIAIDKYGGQKPGDYKKFSVSFEIDGNKIDTNPVRDFFAPAQFFEMSDDQKISKSSYEKYTAGLSDDSETLHSNFKREKAVIYEFKSIDSIEESSTAKGIVLEPASHMAHSAKGTAIAKSQLGRQSNLKKLVSGKQIKYTEEEFVIVHRNDLTPLKETTTGSEFEMQSLLDELLAEKPEMEDNLMAVPAYEIV